MCDLEMSLIVLRGDLAICPRKHWNWLLRVVGYLGRLVEVRFSKISRRVYFILHNLYSFKQFLSVELKSTLFKQIILPHFLYASAVFSGTLSSANTKALSRALRTSVRFVFDRGKRDSISDFVVKLLGAVHKRRHGFRGGQRFVTWGFKRGVQKVDFCRHIIYGWPLISSIWQTTCRASSINVVQSVEVPPLPHLSQVTTQSWYIATFLLTQDSRALELLESQVGAAMGRGVHLWVE
jgi:hypothetical protein